MKYFIIIAIVIFGCDDTESNNTNNTNNTNGGAVCPTGDYEGVKLICSDYLTRIGYVIPEEGAGDLYSCDEHTSIITRRIECSHGCVDDPNGAFCKVPCPETGTVCGGELIEIGAVYWSNASEDSLYNCVQGELPEHIGECDNGCTDGVCE